MTALERMSIVLLKLSAQRNGKIYLKFAKKHLEIKPLS